MKIYAIANAQGNVTVMSALEAPTGNVVRELGNSDSTMALRYGVVNGAIVDMFPGQTDTAILDGVLHAQNTQIEATNVGKVSPVEFKLLFTAAERIAMRAARTSDPVLEDFFDIAEDPRLTFVDLSAASTQQAIGYMAAKGLLTTERAAQVLAGTAP